ADASTRRRSETQAHLERIVARFRDKQAWWDRDFPKDTAPVRVTTVETATAATAGRAPEAIAPDMNVPPPRMASPAAPASPAAAWAAGRVTSRVEEKSVTTEEREPATTITLRAWKPDSPYARRMRDAAADRVYRVYMDERPDYVQSSAFFLDAADILVEKG